MGFDDVQQEPEEALDSALAASPDSSADIITPLPFAEARGREEDSGSIPDSSRLGSRAARGASIVMVGQASRIFIQIGSVAILARLLEPVDYGLIAIVLAVVGVGEILRDFGLSTGAIQAVELSRYQRDKLLWLNTAIGATLAVAGFLVAPLVARIFGQPELTSITRMLSLTFVVSGVTAQYRADLNRRMRFHSLVVADVSSQILGISIAITLALAGWGYWALVAQQLSAALSALVILMLYARWLPGRPRRGVDVKSIVVFGRGMMGSQLVGYLNGSVDTYTIALTMSAGQLGIYNRGFQLVMRPLSQLRAPSTTVALPVLSRLNGDLPRAGRYIVSGQIALGYPLVGVLSFAAGAAVPIVDVFLGSNWSTVAPVFALLAIGGAFQTLSYVALWVYLARALTGQLFKYSLFGLALKTLLVVVGSHWGIVGVAAGYALAHAFEWPISLWWLSRLTPIPVRTLAFGALRISGCAVVAGLACIGSVALLASLPSMIQLLAGALAVAFVYLAAAALIPTVRNDLRDVLLIGRKAIKR